MLNTWLTLRQAEEALKNGRLEEAHRLVKQPDVQGHRKAGDILQQVSQALLERAQLHLQHDDSGAAWKELMLAEDTGISSKTAVKLRQDLVNRAQSEVRALLELGEPGRALDAIELLRERRVQTSELTMLEEAARSWSLARELTARGEFGQALSALDRAGKQYFKPLEDFRLQVKSRRKEFEDVLIRLHESIERNHWREVIQTADQVLALAPQHGEARKARARAWKAVEPPTMAVNVEAPASRKPEPPADELPRRMLLWIDGVGGYLVCLSSRVSLGQATPEACVDVPLYADISRLHGYLTRDAEGYLLEAVRTTLVNGQPQEKALLRDGDRFTFGTSCQLRFHQPVPVSTTSRLELVSGHRLALSVDGVILMADNCVIGPSDNAHIVIPELARPVVLVRRKDSLMVHAVGNFAVDGKACRDRSPVGPHSTVSGDDFRLALEPVGTSLGKGK